MKLRKPLKEKDNMQLFALYNNECSSSDKLNCNQTNVVAGGVAGAGTILPVEQAQKIVSGYQ